MKNPGTAAVLSFLLPGLGQLYNGTVFRGIFWFFFWLFLAPGSILVTGGLVGLVIRAVCAWTAYNYAKDHPY